jgi:uncharacterized protein (TIGR02646 family)
LGGIYLIHVIRLPEPNEIHSRALEAERKKIREYFEIPVYNRKQSRYSTNNPFPRIIKDRLMQQFQNKCAFCEIKIQRSNAHIGRFRPKGGTYFGEGYSPDHYWWLSLSWNNLYLMCSRCNAKKKNKFPILGTPARIGASDVELIDEQPLLLDPCYDQPEQEFAYEQTGMILPLSERADVTITLLDLNDADLVEQRRITLFEFRALVSRFEDILSELGNKGKAIIKKDIQQLQKEIDTNSEFCGMKRFFINEWRNDFSFLRYIDSQLKISSISQNGKNIKNEFFKNQTDDINIKDTKDRQKYYLKQSFIYRIQIKNFKSIELLDIKLTKLEYVTWLMLLGENGTGKSTILQAIALCLMDQTSRESYSYKNASSYLKEGTQEGYVRVWLSGTIEPFEIIFSKNEQKLISNSKNQRVVLLGYGASRLMANEKNKSPIESLTRVENLFDPFSPLVNASEYLFSLDEVKFFYVRSALELLLDLDEEQSIEKGYKKNQILIKNHGSTVALEDLSSGYQTVIALTLDIMRTMEILWKDSTHAEGIVLLDEIDLHLHPKWKIQIVSKLKHVFPGIQFIVTSHEPLCLRGLASNEISVLRRVNNSVRLLNNLPDTSGYEIDQILTSDYFGLFTTLSAEYNQNFEEYYQLLSIETPTKSDLQRITTLRELLASKKQLGRNKEESLLYAVLDEHIAKNHHINLNIQDMNEVTKSRIIDLFRSIKEERK